MTTFPPGFLWGASTAAYQIEGATTEGGRGPSIWDTFAATPGKVTAGETGEPADDHYHRYREDVAIMKRLGLPGYRLSMSWSRLQPAGRGPLNPEGLAFYDRLLDELASAGVTPWTTLYHWDLPQPLEDAGGWPNRDTAYRFVDYAAAVHEHFADRAHDWITFNEPWCSAFLGYFNGVHAPGRTDVGDSLRAMHHLLLAHGMATTALRGARPDGRYGISLNLYPVDPRSDSAADIDAARRVEGVSNRLFTDPVLAGGVYPADIVADLGADWPADAIRDGDAATIAAPIDMLGINYYTRHVVFGDESPDATAAFDNGWVACQGVGKAMRGYPVTSMGWEVDPVGLYDVLTRLRARYPDLPKVYITENGASFDDVVVDGAVHDDARVAFLRDHFVQARRAIDDGVPLHGYFVWSLLDNFEWSFGTTRRFGLVHVDYATQRRTLKDSALFLADVIRAGGLPDPS